MTELLSTLSAWLNQGTSASILGAFVWGMASVLLSPCHLAGVPLVVAYTGRRSRLTGRTAAALSAALAAGILVSVAVAGAATIAVARVLGPFGRAGNYVVALLLFLVGLDLLGVWHFPVASLPRPETNRRGVAGAFTFGLAMGVLLGPCTVAFAAPVMALLASTGADAPVMAAALLAAFATGHCGVIAAAGSAGPSLGRYLSWSEGHAQVLRRGCGVMVIAGGLYLVYTAA